MYGIYLLEKYPQISDCTTQLPANVVQLYSNDCDHVTNAYALTFTYQGLNLSE